MRCPMFLIAFGGFLALATLADPRHGQACAEQASAEAPQVEETLQQCPSAGVSLMQATSVSRRVEADQLSDEDLNDANMFRMIVDADRRTLRHASNQIRAGLSKTTGDRLSAQTYTTASLAAPRTEARAASPSASQQELKNASLAEANATVASRQPSEESPLQSDERSSDPPMSFVSKLAEKGHLAAKSAAQALAAASLFGGDDDDDGDTVSSTRTAIGIGLLIILGVAAYVLMTHPEAVGRCCPGSHASRGPLGEADFSQSYEAEGTSDGMGSYEEAEVTFCPDLVVPSDRECVLYVPVLTDAVNSETVVFKDASGEAVLRAVAKTPTTTFGKPPWQIGLSTKDGDELAQCCEVSDNKDGYQLQSVKGDIFGTLSRDKDRDAYILTTTCRRHLRFWGSFDDQAINVTSDKGRLLATSELSEPDFDKAGRFIRLRIAPLVDTGIVLCSLLCISHHLGR